MSTLSARAVRVQPHRATKQAARVTFKALVPIRARRRFPELTRFIPVVEPVAVAVAAAALPPPQPLVIVRMADAPLAVPYCSTATIEQLKLEISRLDGTAPENMHLVYAGKRLDDCAAAYMRTLVSHNVTPGARVFLMINGLHYKEGSAPPPPPPTMQSAHCKSAAADDDVAVPGPHVYISLLSGKTIVFTYDAQCTVGNLRHMIYAKTSYQPCDQRLFFNRQLLANDTETLAQAGMRGGAVVHMVLRMANMYNRAAALASHLPLPSLETMVVARPPALTLAMTSHVFVKTLAGTAITLEYGDGSCTLRTLCQHVCDSQGISVNQYRLVFAGRTLTAADMDTSLAALGIRREATLHLVFNLRDNAFDQISAAAIAECNDQHPVTVVWAVVTRGNGEPVRDSAGNVVRVKLGVCVGRDTLGTLVHMICTNAARAAGLDNVADEWQAHAARVRVMRSLPRVVKTDVNGELSPLPVHMTEAEFECDAQTRASTLVSFGNTSFTTRGATTLVVLQLEQQPPQDT